jgi:hypothetical protein
MSSPASDLERSEGTFNSSGRAQISKTGRTQLRVYFANDDNSNDWIQFYAGEGSGSRAPELVVEYQQRDASVGASRSGGLPLDPP